MQKKIFSNIKRNIQTYKLNVFKESMKTFFIMKKT